MTDKIKPPTHGPYKRRAELVQAALETLLKKEYEKDLRFIKRGSDEGLMFVWELPARVQVTIRKSAGSADPTIWINREDPTGRTTPDGDWKNEPVQRAYDTQFYDLKAVMEKVNAAVTYNREHSSAHTENMKAMTSELDGVPIPEGTKVLRDPKTGLYTIQHTTCVQGAALEAAKLAIKRIDEICKATNGGKKDAKAPKAPQAPKAEKPVADGKTEAPAQG